MKTYLKTSMLEKGEVFVSLT